MCSILWNSVPSYWPCWLSDLLSNCAGNSPRESLKGLFKKQKNGEGKCWTKMALKTERARNGGIKRETFKLSKGGDGDRLWNAPQKKTSEEGKEAGAVEGWASVENSHVSQDLHGLGEAFLHRQKESSALWTQELAYRTVGSNRLLANILTSTSQRWNVCWKQQEVTLLFISQPLPL